MPKPGRSILPELILCAAVAIAALAVIGGLFFITVPPGNRDILSMAIGAVITTPLATIVGFYFGSSKGSADKTAALADLAAQLKS